MCGRTATSWTFRVKNGTFGHRHHELPDVLPALLLLLFPVLLVHREMLLGEDAVRLEATEVESLRGVRSAIEPEAGQFAFGMADERPTRSYQ